MTSLFFSKGPIASSEGWTRFPFEPRSECGSEDLHREGEGEVSPPLGLRIRTEIRTGTRTRTETFDRGLGLGKAKPHGATQCLETLETLGPLENRRREKTFASPAGKRSGCLFVGTVQEEL